MIRSPPNSALRMPVVVRRARFSYAPAGSSSRSSSRTVWLRAARGSLRAGEDDQAGGARGVGDDGLAAVETIPSGTGPGGELVADEGVAVGDLVAGHGEAPAAQEQPGGERRCSSSPAVHTGVVAKKQLSP